MLQRGRIFLKRLCSIQLQAEPEARLSAHCVSCPKIPNPLRWQSSMASIKPKTSSTISVRIAESEDTVVVQAPNTGDMAFPFVWLRDNCQCENCFHNDSKSRTIDLMSFDINAKPSKISVEANEVKMVWSDGHNSQFSLGWLAEHRFQREAQETWTKTMYRLPRTTWTTETFNKILHRWDYNDIINSEKTMYDWLVSLATYGVSIIEGTPPKVTSVRSLAERVAFVRKTHYGEEFSVKAKPGTTNVAYLSANLQLHTDLPYYHYKPGVNLLHCLVQTVSQGGANKLTDVLAVTEWMRSEHPEMYRILADIAVDWNDIGQEDGNCFHSIHRAPVICENQSGEVERINFSQPQRDSHFNVPLEKVKPWYHAMDKLTKAIHSEEFCITYKMKEGEILTFDNIRLVHGRSKYEDGETIRHVIGSYLDWDEVWSRIRVLRKKFMKEE